MEMKIPKNIRQIGDCGSCQKIYIEDYAATFLKQLAAEKGNTAALAVLYGKTESAEDKRYCFIMGAAEYEYGQMREHGALLSKEHIEQSLRVRERYFTEYDIIGWVLIRSEDDYIPEERIIKTHLQQFGQRNGLYYELHIEEETEKFLFFESGKAYPAAGYHIFYDMNEGMQSYLVQWNARHASSETSNDRAARQFRNIYYSKREERNHKQIIGLLYSATLMMLTLCCVLGISLLNNYEKMKGMETALQHLALAMEEKNLPDMAQEVVSESVTVVEAVETETAEKETEASETETSETEMENEEMLNTETADAKASNEEVMLAETTVSDEAMTATEASETASEKTSEMKEADNMPPEQTTLSKNIGNTYTLSPVREAEVPHAQYIVQKGDTLLKISLRFYNRADMIDEICALNGIENPNDIMQQQKILLP